MNKDQRLLEEAYQAIYESTREPEYFGPEKDKQKWFKWLKKQKHEVHEDDSVSIEGDVSLSGKSLTRIPFNFNVVKGYFFCLNNEITSLQGAPKIVKGTFMCSDNKLTSLQGAPKIVEGYFDCTDNKLTSLEGAPDSVEGYFDCSHNSLASLKGAPSFVYGDFYCSSNKLTSLEGAPKEIRGEFESDQFSDEEYRNFARKRKYVDGKLDKEFDIDLQDF